MIIDNISNGTLAGWYWLIRECLAIDDASPESPGFGIRQRPQWRELADQMEDAMRWRDIHGIQRIDWTPARETPGWRASSPPRPFPPRCADADTGPPNPPPGFLGLGSQQLF